MFIPKIFLSGSFRGDSAKFLIEYFRDAQLTCVDTWTGSDEYGHINFKGVEEEFDRFQQKCRSRVRKIKGTSNSFFSHQDTKFDLIYVDGSHFADDVAVDLINSWSILEVGGIMICDDYIWQHYSRVRDNPCAAINWRFTDKFGYRKRNNVRVEPFSHEWAIMHRE